MQVSRVLPALPSCRVASAVLRCLAWRVLGGWSPLCTAFGAYRRVVLQQGPVAAGLDLVPGRGGGERPKSPGNPLADTCSGLRLSGC